MMCEPPKAFHGPPIEAGRQLAQLRHLLAQVRDIAGAKGGGCADLGLDEAARISAAYERGLPVARRRFDALAEETATWAATVVQLLGKPNAPPRAAAAAQLARELEDALRHLARTIQAE